MIEDEEIEFTLNTIGEEPVEHIGTLSENEEEEISTINEDIYTIGVESLNGKAGHLTLKSINGVDLVGEGDLALATSSQLQTEASARQQSDEALQTAINGKQAQLTETQLAAVNSGVTDTTVAQVATNASNITSLQNTKQDNLTQTQLNAVNSGIDATKVTQIATNTSNITSNTGRITTIERKIPSTATSSNQLTDKSYVDNAIATNTANYISDNGQPFQSLADLEAYSGPLTNNDYAFVETVDSAGNDIYTRYKYNADQGQWAEEYTITNPYFTSDQWASINSGIAANDVAQIGTNKTDIAGLQTSKQDKLTTAQQAAVDSGIDATKVTQIATNASNITSLQTGKQDQLNAAQLAAVNSGIDSTKVAQIATNADNITSLQTNKQDKLTAGTNIDIDSNVVSTQTRGVEYIVGTQTTATNVWTGVSTDNGCSNGTLYVGKTIVYYLPQAGNSSAATLTLTLPDGTTTSAIELRRAGTSTVTTTYAAGNAIFMTYDGTYWKTSAYYDSNSNTVSQLRAQNAYKAVTAITANTLCCGTSAGYIQLDAGSTFDITYPLLWQTAATTAGTTSTTFYYAIEGRTVRNNKSGWTGVANQMVWLVGTLSGNTFTVDTDVFTQTIPTTEDGKVYAPIGIAYSTYQIYFKSPEQFWWFKGGEFRPVAQSEVAPAGFWSDPATITSTGTNLTLNNQLPVTIKNVQIDGNTEQISYTGKNLFEYPAHTGTDNGIDWTVTTDTISGSGTAGGNWTIPQGGYQYFAAELPAGTYTFSLPSALTNNIQLNLREPASAGSTVHNYDIVAGATSVTATTTAVIDRYRFSVRTNGSGNAFSMSLPNKLQLEAGSTSTTYEPYVGGIPSPNPNYPQAVNTVTGEQTVTVMGKNLCTNITISGTTIILYHFNKKSVESGNYSLSTILSEDVSARNVALVIDGDGIRNLTTITGTAGTTISCSFELTEDDIKLIKQGTDCSIRIYKAGANFSLPTVGQLEAGSTATTYEPYQGQSYTIDLGTLELCKIGTYQDYIYKSNGNWYKHAEVGKVAITSSMDNAWTVENNNWYVKISNAKGTSAIPVCSNYFRYNLTASQWGEVRFGASNNNLIFFKAKSQNIDWAGWKGWLDAHDTSLYYVLATATDTQITNADLITQLEALASAQMKAGQTNIISSGTPPNLDAILTIDTFQNNWNGLSSYILEANS